MPRKHSSRSRSPARKHKSRSPKKSPKAASSCVTIKYNWGKSPKRWRATKLPKGWRATGGGTFLSKRAKYSKDEMYCGPAKSRQSAKKAIRKSMTQLKTKQVVRNFTIA